MFPSCPMIHVSLLLCLVAPMVLPRIERAIDLSFSRQARVDTGLSEQAERCDCVRDEAVPQMHGELGATATDDGN